MAGRGQGIPGPICPRKIKEEHFDYFVFGHRHLPLVLDLNEKSKLFYLGDWIENFTYAVIDGDKLELKHYS